MIDKTTHDVMAAMSAKGLTRTSPENVQDVLEALAKLAAPEAPTLPAVMQALRDLLLDVQANVLDGDAARNAQTLIDNYDEPEPTTAQQAPVPGDVSLAMGMLKAFRAGTCSFPTHAFDQVARFIDSLATPAATTAGNVS